MPTRLAATDPQKQIPEAIGSGPFKFLADERIPGQRVVFAKNDAYVPRSSGVASFNAGPKIVNIDRVVWTIIFLDDVVEAEMESQPEDVQARFKRMVLLIGEFGPQRLPSKYVCHLEGRLWELRMKGKDGISRALYVTAVGRRFVVVRVFIKKTQKTPNRQIEFALRRAKEIRND